MKMKWIVKEDCPCINKAFLFVSVTVKVTLKVVKCADKLITRTNYNATNNERENKSGIGPLNAA